MNEPTKKRRWLRFGRLGTIVAILMAVVVLAAAARNIVGKGSGEEAFVFYRVQSHRSPHRGYRTGQLGKSGGDHGSL